MTKSLSILNEMTIDHDKFYIDQFFLHTSILRCHNVSCQSCVAYVYDENQIWRCTRNYCMQQRYKYERGRIDSQVRNIPPTITFTWL